MFDEVFGSINFGHHSKDGKRCPCGCVCVCYQGEAERVSNTNSRVSTARSTELAQDPYDP